MIESEMQGHILTYSIEDVLFIFHAMKPMELF